MTPNWGEIVVLHGDGAAIQRDFVTVNTVQSPTLVKDEHLGDRGGVFMSTASCSLCMGREHEAVFIN